jgi:proline iminopeptidase
MMPRGCLPAMVVALLIAGTAGCQEMELRPGGGFVDVPGGRVWYRVVGSGSRTPLLVIHGGPGGSHYYLKSLAALSSDRPVVFYDQLGGGRSDRPSDSTLWRVDRFVEEIARVREDLHLREVHLYSHSGGSIPAFEYMLTKPAGVKSLTLASPIISFPLTSRGADSLLRTLPDEARAAIVRNEAAGTFGAPEYRAGMGMFFLRYFARRQPWSADMDTAFAVANREISVYMQGPSQFTITGTLKDYDQTGRLGELRVPTLFTVGQYDEVAPDIVQYYHSLVPGSELAVIEDSGHLTMHDQPERYIQVLREFLDRVDRR